MQSPSWEARSVLVILLFVLFPLNHLQHQRITAAYLLSRIRCFDLFGADVIPPLWALVLHFPGGQLLLRDHLQGEFELAGATRGEGPYSNTDLCIMLRLRHMHRHVGQGLEALPTPHALQDLPRL